MIRKETRIINGREAHLYYDEERQAYLVASDLMEVFLGLYENKDKPVNQLAEESNLTPCYLGSPCEYQRENAKMPMEYWNNGWIPCSERLPEIGTLVLVTTESGNVCDNVLIYDYEHSKSKEPCFHRWNDEMWECYTPRVLAWQPLPAPYKPGEK